MQKYSYEKVTTQPTFDDARRAPLLAANFDAATNSRAAYKQRSSIFDLSSNWKHLFNRPAGQVEAIDGVRAIAIFWVVAYHIAFDHFGVFPQEVYGLFSSPSMGWLINGYLGVNMFFVISGYLIGSILFSEFRDTGRILFARFYARRFLRLIPVYTMVMILSLALFSSVPGGLRDANAQNVWANLLYVNNLLPDAKQFMEWCWSLAIEEQFYLLMPAFLILFMRRGKGHLRILAALLFLSPIIRYAILHVAHITLPMRETPGSPGFYRFLDIEYTKLWMRYGGLLAGVIGAYLSCFRSAELKRFFEHTKLVALLTVAGLIVFAYFICTSITFLSFERMPALARNLWLAIHHDAFSVALLVLILTAIYSSSVPGQILRSILSWKGFYPVAQLSYSIYLTNDLVFGFLFPMLGPKLAPRVGVTGAIVSDGVLALTIVIVLAVILYLFVERPCMRLRSRLKMLDMISALGGPKGA